MITIIRNRLKTSTFLFRLLSTKTFANVVSFFLSNIDYSNIFVICVESISKSIMWNSSNRCQFKQKKIENRRVIESIVVSNEINLNYVFREYQYEKISIRLKNNKNIIDVCMNFDNFLIINNQKFFVQQLFDAII